jgi:hypothetical protein
VVGICLRGGPTKDLGGKRRPATGWDASPSLVAGRGRSPSPATGKHPEDYEQQYDCFPHG